MFLEAESRTAHMHVGWVARFAPPPGGRAPAFDELRAHVAARLAAAPRYRQRLAPVPLGLNTPQWVADERFDLDRHLIRSPLPQLDEMARLALSSPLDRERPLWELWIADSLADGSIGVVGKAHHCMVDGMAAIALALLLVDLGEETPAPPAAVESWDAGPAPATAGLIAGALRDRLTAQASSVVDAVRHAAAPADVVRDARRIANALVHTASSSAPPSPLNVPLSPLRTLVPLRRSRDELREAARHHGVSFNDLALAGCAGGLRTMFERRGEPVSRLRASVPVNVRRPGSGRFGNRFSFMLVDLPCDEPRPLHRLMRIHFATRRYKSAGVPDGADALLRAAAAVPPPVAGLVSRLGSSPRTFNLAISNVPGPPGPVYLRGCRLREVYPVVPLADRHALAIGVMTAGADVFFGLHADPRALPDVRALAGDIDAALDELKPTARRRRAGAAPRGSRRLAAVR